MPDYRPPYLITPSILSLVADIAERVGRLGALEDNAADLRLRRINRIRSIQGTLAIEGNRLTVEQITAMLEGRRVLASPRELQEVRNALMVYDRIADWRPDDEAHLLEAHRLLMAGLMDEAGGYRTGGVGVMAGDTLVHLAPPADRVPVLMADLLRWLHQTSEHPLVAGSILHYEMEFIHPFADGNGRMGRLWQTLILSRWRPLFADLPIENLVHANQDACYQALQDSTDQAGATPFIAFMLAMIRAALADLESAPLARVATEQAPEQVTEQVRRLAVALAGDSCAAKDLMARLGLVHRPTFLYHYLRPALAAGLVAMTDPKHPRSPRQRYRLTTAGQSLTQTS